MKFFPDSKTFISIFGLDIAWYAIIIITGAIIALMITLKEAEKRGINKEDVEDIFFGVLLFGIVGARLWYVIFYPDINYFLSDPLRIIAFRDGGLAIQGGLVAGAAYAYYKCKKLNIDFLDLGDSALPSVLVAQAIGRWGNFVNQEAYGEIWKETYYRFFPKWFQNQMFINGEYRQPMFFYESILNLLGFFLIKFALPKVRKMKKGDYIYAYLIWYGAVRFVIEHFRTDSLMFMGLKSAQLTSVLFILIGALGMYGIFRKKDQSNDSGSSSKSDEKPLVLFDFDGTVGDTGPLIMNSFEHVFTKYFPEFQLTEEMKLSFIGPTLQHSFSKYLETDDVDVYITEYKRVNKQMQREQLLEIKNATALFKELSKMNADLGIVSSKMRDSLDLGVNLLGFDKYVSYVLGGDEVEHPKPNPQGILKAKAAMNNSTTKNYYVGDTKSDILAANAAGFISIGVVTTPAFEAGMREANADYIVYDLLEITKIIEEGNNEQI